MVYDEHKRWADFSSNALGLSNIKANIQATPFSLVYRAEAVVPVEIMVPSTRLALASKVTDPRERIHDVSCR